MTSKQTHVLGVIPARLASTRLHRKVLREIAGKPLLQWVYEAARRCPELDNIVIAADSPDVEAICAAHFWPCILTSPNLPSGTDRLFAVAQHLPAAIYVNIQGDEPLLHPDHISALLAPFTNPEGAAASNIDVTTLKVRCRPEDIPNPNAVKVVTALDGRALYFSRSPIPHHRDQTQTPAYWKHLGLYAYRHAALTRFASLPPTPLEQTERLEQLRMLENNMNIHVAETTRDTIGVDTEADLHQVEAFLTSR
jgi:3-deoxy-manno-octulosonate cytidylyltransferase (CMP-KDO synthetase)